MRWILLGLLLSAVLTFAPPAAAQDGCAGGVALQPGMDVSATVSSAPAGSSFCFAAGEYSNVHVEPRNGDRYICASGAVFNGNGRTDGLMRAMYGLNDPRNVTNVTISGCTVRNYGSDSNFGGGIVGRGAVEGNSNWVVENNVFESNAIALTFANNWGAAYDFILRNNAIRNNSEASLFINGSGFTVEGNTIEGNGFGVDVNTVSWFGSLKITCQPMYDGTPITCDRGGVLRGNTISGNNGNGIWFDLFARDVRVESNTISGNTWNGVMCEICYGVQISGNTLRGNGTGTFKEWLWRGGQILIANGSGVNVSGNRLYVSDGTRGIIVIDESYREPRTVGTQIVDNTVIYQTGANYSGWDPISGYSGSTHSMSALSSTWDRTTYCADASQPHWYQDGPHTFAEWQALGYDANGRVVAAGDAVCG